MARRAAIIKASGKLKFEVRRRRRCKICGRARGILRKFSMCRICFRNQALGGYIPGIVKATW